MAAVEPHTPVLIEAILRECAPITGRWLDGTFGAGGYTRRLLAAGATHVTGIDRDPLAFELAADWLGEYEGRITLTAGVFSALDDVAQDLDGVVLDLGVSSMQLDRGERGFSFMKDGPLDMRMGQTGPTAADLVNTAAEASLADILYVYGEERASRRIAKAMVAARPIRTTLHLAEVIEGCLPRAKPGQSHPATRSFQALRIAVNDEYSELHQGLMAAERALKPGGQLAVVTFHSVEDRMVKRFFADRAGKAQTVSRHAPEMQTAPAQFTLKTRKAIAPDPDEIAANPRARSAKLRVATRTDAPAGAVPPKSIAMPMLKERP